MELAELLSLPQFSLDREAKKAALLPILSQLHLHHVHHSQEYKSISDRLFGGNSTFESLSDLPFLPVSAFKQHDLKSIPADQVFKILTSSGTTGQQVSRITLDRETAKLQTLALSKIISHVVGNTRLPMLIIDSKAVFSARSAFSARGAGILGLSVFGKDHTYALDEHFEPDLPIIESFLAKYEGQPVLIFGFTFMVWQYLHNLQLSKQFDLSKAVLLHSGGWKKLIELSVSNDAFRKALQSRFGIEHIYNFYGMVEQVGSVFLENSEGFLHCPNFADVIIRNPVDFSVQPNGKEGLIQVLSTLPLSYPGHSILTEDIGVITGEDDAKNRWNGKHFRILGRAKKAELRGCSDTFKQK